MADERLDFEPDSPWRGEHYFRYAEIMPYINNDDTVLDIACGSGYGTYKIANKTANKVIGGDISKEAVEECNRTWKMPNLNYRVLNGTAIDFPDGFFNKVVSFETIEHTTEYMKMLNELKRVMRDDGTAFISTPNILINSPKGYVENPYHTQEFQLGELHKIMSEVFEKFEIFGQKYSRYDSRPSFPGKHIVEKLFNQRIIRRSPVSLKNKVANLTIGKDFYPQEDDFTLVKDEKEILKCQTFFCICRK